MNSWINNQGLILLTKTLEDDDEKTIPNSCDSNCDWITSFQSHSFNSFNLKNQNNNVTGFSL